MMLNLILRKLSSHHGDVSIMENKNDLFHSHAETHRLQVLVIMAAMKHRLQVHVLTEALVNTHNLCFEVK